MTYLIGNSENQPDMFSLRVLTFTVSSFTSFRSVFICYTPFYSSIHIDLVCPLKAQLPL